MFSVKALVQLFLVNIDHDKNISSQECSLAFIRTEWFGIIRCFLQIQYELQGEAAFKDTLSGTG